jgi:predicted kinase
MSKLFITVGLPASGKSTYSKKWVEESPKTRVRVNRDDIRRMLGPYWIPTRESLVTLI